MYTNQNHKKKDVKKKKTFSLFKYLLMMVFFFLFKMQSPSLIVFDLACFFLFISMYRVQVSTTKKTT